MHSSYVHPELEKSKPYYALLFGPPSPSIQWRLETFCLSLGFASISSSGIICPMSIKLTVKIDKHNAEVGIRNLTQRPLFCGARVHISFDLGESAINGERVMEAKNQRRPAFESRTKRK